MEKEKPDTPRYRASNAYHTQTNPELFDATTESRDKSRDPTEPCAQSATSDIPMHTAKFPLGAQVKHRVSPFRGIIFDVDPHFNNSEEWYESIPAEIRPRKDQPFYHLLAENAEQHMYIAYVSEQSLLPDTSKTPINHEDLGTFFSGSLKSGLETRQMIH